jgi:CheY-like chemotaxis protein
VPRQPPLILVVDDFEDAREMYAEYFAFCGFRTVEAATGQQALEVARTSRPDVILMDLSLPGMDGWEATRRLKADPGTRSIPVLAVTGHALNGFSDGARQAGCDGFITKPCLPERLVSEVCRVLGLAEPTVLGAASPGAARSNQTTPPAGARGRGRHG